jgi:peptidoglycan hydrolase FlgJ
MAVDQASARMALDARGLDGLKRQAREAPDKALAAAAKQFEAIFMQMLLKSMRDAVPDSGLTGGSEMKTYTSMFDQEIAQKLSAKGMGIADMLVKQLSQRAGAGGAAGDSMPAESRGRVSIDMSGKTRDLLARLSTATTDARSAGDRAQSFVATMLPHAAQAERATGVPSHYILGQAALESGWGQREIRAADGAPSYNLFGIKAGAGWQGASVETTTTEYVNGVPRKQVERFRAYGSYAEAFQDYARLLTSNPRYAEVLRNGRDVAGFAWGLQNAGYATDPAYAEKLTRVINHTLAISRTG